MARGHRGWRRDDHGRERAAHAAARAALVVALVAGLWLGLLAPGAAAHALLIAADPAVDATVARSPGRRWRW